MRTRRTLRFFGHVDGYGTAGNTPTPYPIQPTVGVFSEPALRHYDLVLALCAEVRGVS